MLEIRDLTKIYKTKGEEVKALDGVSISFGETGLVFLLGKSGSGKSTLLNLIGGLDAPSAGEIVVMGRSSKDFTGGDFDSYRNTFVGFVFQEYNVLDEFNVEDNVSLALELQGKTREKEKVRAILEEVELTAFRRRKPNTLSGGQKQRVAIARALVKDPQIILADEPTGALDSATGKQVFETLKRLSSTRLVLVVSHDRDFAEEYGDRIVELKDGKIVSDVTKTRETGTDLGGRIKQVGEHTLFVRAGAPDEATLGAIRTFLSEGTGEVVLTKGEAEIAAFRKANRIDAEGGRERFVATDETKLERREYGQTKFIRARLPAGKAIRIGASGLKLKPLRLVFTILLSLVSFLMFGLSSTMMLYDGESVLVRSFLDSGMEYVRLEKRYRYTVETTFRGGGNASYETNLSTDFTPEEVEKFSSETPAIGAYELGRSVSNITRAEGIGYYLPEIGTAAFAPEGSVLRKGLVGRYPLSSDEICISSYLCDCMLHLDYFPAVQDGMAAEPLALKTAEDVLGQTLLFGKTPLKIVGIFESGPIPEKYGRIKTLGDLELADNEDILDNAEDILLYLTFSQYISEGLHALILTGENFRSDHAELLSRVVHYDENADSFESEVRLEDGGKEIGRLGAVEVFDPQKRDCTFFDENKTALSGNEILVPAYFLATLAQKFEPEDEVAILDALDVLQGGEGDREEAERTIRALFQAPYPCTAAYLQTELGDMQIVGILGDKSMRICFSCSQELYDSLDAQGLIYMRVRTNTRYSFPEDAEYSVLLVPCKGTASAFRALYGRTGVFGEDDVKYEIGNVIVRSVTLANEIIDVLHTVFLVLGIVLALFSSLLLFNFISMSISNKRKEIGILRAVGARGTDVFKIFFAESGIIVGVCTLLAIVGSAVAASFLNATLRRSIGLDVSLFVFGLPSVAVMLGVAVAVAFLGTFLPVWLSARKKPVDSIRAL